jgi:nifR3 family TIM-barrel protein
MSFWDSLAKPIMVLAPMADVTDAAFRRVIAKYSKVEGGTPFVFWTEFVSADGLARAPEEGRKKLLAGLMFSEVEHPIVAQFFSGRPENMEKAAALAKELGFDGVDINMGCPDKSIEKQGAGAAHIKNPKLAQEVIEAAMRGASGLPVSVKTRLGYNKDELEEWMPALLKVEPAVITIHARTRKEMSLVPARWDRVARAAEIRNQCQDNILTSERTLILGNGDLKDVSDAHEKVLASGADGAMLGRAIFGNPWLFAPSRPPLAERLRVMVEHTKLYEELLPHKSFAIMKKHYKAYAHGFNGAAELRALLMSAENATEIEAIVDNWLVAHH